jgi:hypothetical protein
MSTPEFLLFELHIRYFSGILLNHLRPGRRSGTGFPTTMEHQIVLAVCIILLVFGVPAAMSSNSIPGWIADGIGTAGTVALIVNSVLPRSGELPLYNYFLAGIFFFFVFLPQR